MAEKKHSNDFFGAEKRATNRGKLSEYQRDQLQRAARRKEDEALDKQAIEDSVRYFADDDGNDDEGLRGNIRNDDAFDYARKLAPPRPRTGPNQLRMRASGPGTLDNEIPTPAKVSQAWIDDPRLPYPDHRSGHPPARDARAAHLLPRPTIQMVFLPEDANEEYIRSILPEQLKVDEVRIDFKGIPFNAKSFGRPSTSATIILTSDTPSAHVDVVVSALNNKYLKRGYFLLCLRGKSSHLGEKAPEAPASGRQQHPFGAVEMTVKGGGPNKLVVQVRQPSELKMLRLIHNTVEAILDPRTDPVKQEVSLMANPEIQNDVDWAWLFDSCSPGGVYYRWRMWEVCSGAKNRPRHSGDAPRLHRIYNSGPEWLEPAEELPAEFAGSLGDLEIDPDVDMSMDIDDLEEAGRSKEGKDGHRQHPYPPGEDPMDKLSLEPFLGPIERAQLVYLLSSLPTSTSRLRAGDITGISGFVVSEAGCGASEIIEILVDNVMTPLNIQDQARLPAAEQTREEQWETYTSAVKVALFVLSDLMQTCQKSTANSVWKLRTAIPDRILRRKLFSLLGYMEKEGFTSIAKADRFRRIVLVSTLNVWTRSGIFREEQAEEATKQYNDETGAGKATRAFENFQSTGPQMPVKTSANDWQKFRKDYFTPNPANAKEEMFGSNASDPLIDSVDESGDANIASSDLPVEELPPEEAAPTLAPVATKRERPRAADMFD